MEAVVVIAFIVIAWISYRVRNSALADASNQTTVYVDQIADLCQLSSGPVEAVLIRQSGNEYRDLGEFDNADGAVAEVVKSLKRAQIESLRVQRNTSSELRVHRLFHSHRGRAEGKKLGGAVIRTLAE